MATTKTNRPAPCECGCGNATIRPEARFIPGHDAKLKSALIRTALDPKATPAARKAAEARVRALGWELHLAIAKAKLERETARKARAAEAKASGRKPAAPAKPARKAVATGKPKRTGDVRTPAGGTVPASVGRLAHDPEPAMAS